MRVGSKESGRGREKGAGGGDKNGKHKRQIQSAELIKNNDNKVSALIIQDQENALSFEHVILMEQIVCTRCQINFQILRDCNTNNEVKKYRAESRR